MAREVTVSELRIAFRARLATLVARPYSAEGDAMETMTRKALDALTQMDFMVAGFDTPDAKIACRIEDEGDGAHWIGDEPPCPPMNGETPTTLAEVGISDMGDDHDWQDIS
jgi:hypothetical protein